MIVLVQCEPRLLQDLAAIIGTLVITQLAIFGVWATRGHDRTDRK